MRTFESFDVGETFHSRGRTVTESDIRMFIGATDAADPIHVDHEYAEAHPLVETVCAQGTLLLGIADGLLVDKLANNAALAMNYGHDKVRYLTAVYPGDTLTATLEITATDRQNDEWGKLTIRIDMVNQNDERVLIDIHRLLVGTDANPALPDVDIVD
ncbi:MaoC family dehydratase [Haladaptatus halobius]|uniref:MaoC family dehydratase n=1 Tax=Haladaptatus halobius TaxID=2884875 RepID=UPI001D0B6227|nr:MaoC/PaaZ C-terminal domain-containing protein [Haladaptatus halobius]